MKRISVKLGNRLFLVKVENIRWIQSERNYIRIHMGKRSYLLRETLRNFEKKLSDEQFVRINRSIIVNIDLIKELRSHNKSDYRVVLDDDHSWIWGRRFRENMRQILS
jgi:two-component system LytT family response regulator